MGQWTPVIVVSGVALAGGVLVGLGVYAGLQGALPSPAPDSAEQAVVLDFADGLVRDQEAITAAYARACSEGWEPGCEAESFRGDRMAAERALSGYCSEEDPASCLAVGWARTQLDEDGQPAEGIEDLVWDGVADPYERDYAAREWRGADAFEMACEAGNARGCAELGRCMGWGLGRKQSWSDANLYLRLACTLGSPEGCNWMGDLAIHRGQDSPEDWFGEACEMGLADGCRNLVVYDGSSEERKTEVWREGCATDLRSCDFLARRLAEEGAVIEASELYAAACEGGIQGSCSALSLLADEP